MNEQVARSSVALLRAAHGTWEPIGAITEKVWKVSQNSDTKTGRRLGQLHVSGQRTWQGEGLPGYGKDVDV